MSSLLSKVKNKLGLKKQSSSTGHKLGGADTAQQLQQPPQQPQQHRLFGSNKPPPLKEEEKEARRGAMAAAAANREKAWDKKVSKGAQQRRQEEKRREEEKEEGDAPYEVKSEETLKIIEEAKRSEEELARTMGYNPYKPVMSTSSKGVQGSGGGTTTSNSNGTPAAISRTASGTPIDPFNDIDEEVKDQFVGALECLLLQELPGAVDNSIRRIQLTSHDEEKKTFFEQGKTCINTVVKMLTNLEANPDDPKFRSIRLSNKHFRGKVAEVEGGLELIMSAGFILMEEGGEDGSEPDTFLKHVGVDSSEVSVRQLHFTLSRLRHVQSLL